MTRPIDPDVKRMGVSELRREVMRLRTAFRKELDHTGNHRCWITLMEEVEGKSVCPLSLPRKEFLANCRSYYHRNTNRRRDVQHHTTRKHRATGS